MGAYDPRIDGLRAVAVLSVILYHLNNWWLPGGFLGVDVFFVISGYLISRAVIRETIQGTFSFADFYRRRIKRILPAYLFMLAIVTAVALIVLLPYDLKKFAVEAGSSLLFASNMGYGLRAGDYFSEDAAQWPLLHTWSLSVEEQFYLAWPVIAGVVIWAARRRGADPIAAVKWAAITLGVASLTLGALLWATPGMGKWAYYAAPARAFELLIGAGIAVYHLRGGRPFPAWLASVALVVLVVSFVVFSEGTPMPMAAVLPCAAAAILIGGDTRGAAYRLLSSRPMVWVGLLSFSLYLWHWPVFAFHRYIFDFGGRPEGVPFEIGASAAAILLAITFALAWLSYRFVEQPVRRSSLDFRPAFAAFVAAPLALGASLYGWTYTSHGLPQRLDTQAARGADAFYALDKGRCPDFVNLGCRGGDIAARDRVLLVGNSHAEHVFEAISAIGDASGVAVDLASSGGCSPLSVSARCRSVYGYAVEHGAAYRSIILAHDWDDDDLKEGVARAALDRLVTALKATGRPVTLLGALPRYTADIDKVVNYQRLIGEPSLHIGEAVDTVRLNNLLSAYAEAHGVGFLDLHGALQQRGFRLSYMDTTGAPMYVDADHLSVHGARQIGHALLTEESALQLVGGL